MEDEEVKEEVVEENTTEESAEESAQEEQSAPTIEELTTELENAKKRAAGSDRAYQNERKAREKAEKEKEEQKKANMDEAERLKYEAEQEKKKYQNALFESAKTKAINELGLKNDIGDVLDKAHQAYANQDGDGIREALSALKEFTDNQVQDGANALWKKWQQETFGDKQAPKSGDKKGELSYSDINNMSDEELRQNYTAEQIQEITNKG